MSPVFRHGRLRLYLLKLLDESPRHGYEVIRHLQDRFMGVYAPSPGTIYPRLARLEEEGLVTHEDVEGRKVYSITDKGRAEIRSRLSDLADLEDELTESLRDVAREISVDVRETVRSLREELASAARGFRGPAAGEDGSGQGKDAAGEAGSPAAGAGSRRIREEARRSREQLRANFRAGRADAGWPAFSQWSQATGDDTEPGADASRPSGPGPFGDLEAMATQFAAELRAAARQTSNLGERSLSELRDILTDTLARVRTEVFPGEDGQEPGDRRDDTES